MRTPIVRLLVLVGMTLIMGGCGTVTTVFRGDDVTVRELKGKKTIVSLFRVSTAAWRMTCACCMGRRILQMGFR